MTRLRRSCGLVRRRGGSRPAAASTLALGQPQQRQAGLRLAPHRLACAVRLLGRARTRRAAGAARPAGRRPRRPPAAPGGRRGRSQARRASSMASGQAPCSCMISARCTRHWPRYGHQVGLGRAPVAQRRRPLLRPAQVEDLLARLDHAAVDVPDDDRRRPRRPVTATMTSSSSATPSAVLPSRISARPWPCRASVTRSGSPKRSPISAAWREGGVRGRDVALEDALQRGRERAGIPAPRSRAAVVEQPPGAGEPAAAAGEVAAVQQAEGQPERAAGGPRGVAARPGTRDARAPAARRCRRPGRPG